MHYLYAYLTHEVETVGNTVKVMEDHPLDTSLDNQLATLHTRRRRDIQGRILRGIIATGHLCDGICLGMKHIWLCQAVLILTDILHTRRRTVIAIRNNHVVLDQNGTDLPTHTI